MLLVTFDFLDSKKQVKFPPFITTIDTALLNTKVQELKKQIHHHFKLYISPFITSQNLKLSSKQATPSMIDSFPLYMYLDYSQAIQYIQCCTQPKAPDEEEKWKFAKNQFVYKGSNDSTPIAISQKMSKAIEVLLDREIEQKKGTMMIINGQVLQKTCEQKWGRFVEDHWKEWALSNECIYVRFCEKQPLL